MVVKIAKPEGGFTPIEGVGHFQGKVHKIDISEKAGPSGYRYFIMTFRLPSDHPKFPNANDWWRPSLSPKAVFSLRRFCREAGMDVPSDSEDWEFEDPKAMLEAMRDGLLGQPVEWNRVPQEDNPGRYNTTDVHISGHASSGDADVPADGEAAATADGFKW